MEYEELVKLAKQHSKLEEKILTNVPSWDECKCEEDDEELPETFEYIHWGHFPEVMSICLKCGGMREITCDMN